MAKKMAPKKTPGKKLEKVVSEAGETQYVVINPAQIEKLEEAVNRLTAVVEKIANKETRLTLNFPDAFWWKLFAGLFASAGHEDGACIENADSLIAAIGKGKK